MEPEEQNIVRSGKKKKSILFKKTRYGEVGGLVGKPLITVGRKSQKCVFKKNGFRVILLSF